MKTKKEKLLIKKTLKKRLSQIIMKKKLNKKKDTIYDHVTKNNAISSLILPLLKRLKYDHEKIKKPKPDIFINIKSDEIYDQYYNIQNNIELNEAYQAALYKIEIENISLPLSEYKCVIKLANFKQDIELFSLIKNEYTLISKNLIELQIKRMFLNLSIKKEK